MDSFRYSSGVCQVCLYLNEGENFVSYIVSNPTTKWVSLWIMSCLLTYFLIRKLFCTVKGTEVRINAVINCNPESVQIRSNLLIKYPLTYWYANLLIHKVGGLIAGSLAIYLMRKEYTYLGFRKPHRDTEKRYRYLFYNIGKEMFYVLWPYVQYTTFIFYTDFANVQFSSVWQLSQYNKDVILIFIRHLCPFSNRQPI